jgi:hypothetical protein
LRQKLEEERRKFEQDKRDLELIKSTAAAQIEQSRNVAPEVKDAFRAVEQLKAELRERDERETEKKYATMERQLDEQISKVVKDEEYDVIDKLGLHNEVKNKLVELHKKNGKPSTIKEACDLVAEEVAEKYNKIKDSKHLKPKAKVEEEKPVVKTALTNKMVQNTPVSKPKTDDDRLKAAQEFLKASKGIKY